MNNYKLKMNRSFLVDPKNHHQNMREGIRNRNLHAKPCANFAPRNDYQNLREAVNNRDVSAVLYLLGRNPELLDPIVELYLVREGKMDFVKYIISAQEKIFKTQIEEIVLYGKNEAVLLYCMKYEEIIKNNIEILLEKKLKKINLELLKKFQLSRKHFEMMDLKDPEIVAAGIANCKNEEDYEFWMHHSEDQEEDGYLIL